MTWKYRNLPEELRREVPPIIDVLYDGHRRRFHHDVSYESEDGYMHQYTSRGCPDNKPHTLHLPTLEQLQREEREINTIEKECEHIGNEIGVKDPFRWDVV